MLASVVLCMALRLFGAPSHLTRRPSATKFWAVDFSAGAGSLSTPVMEEHPKNVSEAAMQYERTFSKLAEGAPLWFSVGMLARSAAARTPRPALRIFGGLTMSGPLPLAPPWRSGCVMMCRRRFSLETVWKGGSLEILWLA